MALNQAGSPPYQTPIDNLGGKVSVPWLQWFNKLSYVINSISWSAINFTGSNLTDIQTRNHNDLQSMQGGLPTTEYYHLSNAQHGLFTSGTIHQILHGSPTLPTWSAVDLALDVTGIAGPANGGTGVANNAASTLTISGNFASTLTITGTTGVTLPTTGTLSTLAGAEELTNKTLNASVAKGAWTTSGTWTVPAHTLGGDISAAGYNIDNAAINPTTALAVRGSTIKATTVGGFISSDNSTGYTGAITAADLVTKTITVKDGIITAFA